MAYELIETIEVGAGGAASIEFTSIPQDGVDLLLKTSVRTDRASATADGINVALNNSTSNFTGIQLYGRGGGGTPVTSTTTTRLYFAPSVDATANTFSNGATLISNYAGSANKSISTDGVHEDNAATAYAQITATQWANSAAVTSVKITPNTGTNFVQYSTASLFKIY